MTQIKWENRKTNDVGNDCLVGIDCVDFRFQQIKIPNPKKPGKMMVNKALYSHKFNGPGLRYQVGLCLRTDDICNIEGPFACGDWPDWLG